MSDRDTLFINGSLTALDMLSYVKDRKVTVYTNNCYAVERTFPDGVSIHLTGGEVREHVMIGDYVMRNLLNLSADKTFIGCAAVYDDGEFRYDIPTEIGINEAMISMTDKEIYILADHSKIGRSGTFASFLLEKKGCIITDNLAPMSVIDRLRNSGMEVIRVSEEFFRNGVI